jgi:hypothetical protein
MTRRAMGIPVSDKMIRLNKGRAFKELELRTVGNIEPDSGNGRSGGECHRTAETR